MITPMNVSFESIVDAVILIGVAIGMYVLTLSKKKIYSMGRNVLYPGLCDIYCLYHHSLKNENIKFMILIQHLPCYYRIG